MAHPLRTPGPMRAALARRLQVLAARLDGTGPDAASTAYRHHGPRPADLPPPGPIEAAFWANQGRVAHKWQHFFPVYERHFAPFRGRAVRMLAIGVSRGGSLALWRDFFGPAAVIFGIDINPDCAALDGPAGRVRVGSQADPAFLDRVLDEMGGIDIVLDDGSHRMEHIRASFDHLFPRLAEGGIYVVEDLLAAYWPAYGGGYRAPGSFIETVKVLIDDMHHWYHREGERIAAAAGHLRGLHVYDSIVVLDKARVTRPFHTMTGEA